MGVIGYKRLFNIGSLRIGAHLFETRTGKQTKMAPIDGTKYMPLASLWENFLPRNLAIPLVVGGDIILNKMYMGDYYARLGLRLYF